MCLAIPAKIESISGVEATVEIGGVSRAVSVLFTPEAGVGDYVYVHSGYAISVLDEAQAQESLHLLRELAETYPAEELFLTSDDLPSPIPGTADP
jgi:hydrogenase expression/formation protein HypC